MNKFMKNYAKDEPYYGFSPEDPEEGPDEQDVIEFHDLTEDEWKQFDEEEQEAMISDYILTKKEESEIQHAENQGRI